MGRRLTTELFVKRARKIHGDLFGYDKAVYRNARSKVLITCKRHGEFRQSPANHLYQRQGCPKCKRERHCVTQSEFVERARKRYGDHYDYSEAVYSGMHVHATIRCRKPGHGRFKQTPISHLQGVNGGCKTCWRETIRDQHQNSRQEFLEQAWEKHGKNTYDYSKTVYRRRSEKIIVICRIHGKFVQEAGSHLYGSGCPGCAASHGERAVALFLDILCEPYKREARIIPGRREAFDFYLPERKALVEFHGQHHYMVIPLWGGQKHFAGVQRRDRFKARWARRNNLRLIVIPYTAKDVAAFLSKKLGLSKAAA